MPPPREGRPMFADSGVRGLTVGRVRSLERPGDGLHLDAVFANNHED